MMSAMQVPRRRRYGVVAAAAAILALAVSAAVLLYRGPYDRSPWWGRGAELKPLPYHVIAGPVEIGRGIPGVVEFGTPRRAILRRIGPPLIARLTEDEVHKRGFVDEEDLSRDLLSGVFAWVSYNGEDRVSTIRFELTAFADRFHGEQEVLLCYRGHQALLGTGMSRPDLASVLKRLGLAVRDINGVIEVDAPGSILIATFDERGQHLGSLEVSAGNE